MGNVDFFPEIITNLPEADIPVEGVKANLFQGEQQQIIFMTFDNDAEIPAHSHGAQWAVVLDGEIELTIAGDLFTFRKGDTYFIPGNVIHSARVKKGYKDLTLFDQKDRYGIKPEIKTRNEARIKGEVWEFVQKMNRLWTVEGDTDGLKHYFHENMVAVTAAEHERLQGRDDCIRSWKRFVEAARIRSWKEIDPKIELFDNGKTAVVAYYYEITFEREGRTHFESGRDMFTLISDSGKWWIVSNHFSSYPGK